ncbi:alpha/beta-hydrolase [Leucogyrophana mollusca]|uniref:Alpha/beta-hydrolase n=1 Tax=Leucogyrophana mollusca TaxID=85980 RepID=A0ACB8BFL9_9AGAM|nr:alpha/beta-hydrolase [Leucogyrophana mollusca]
MAERGLTLWDKLSLIPAAILAGFSLSYTIISAPFRSRAKTLDRELSIVLARALRNRLTVRQLQAYHGSSASAWERWVSTQPGDVEYETEELDDDAKLHWIGDNVQSTKIMLHVHGGGYVLPLTVEHLKLLSYFRDCVQRDTGVEMAVAVLEYTLAPHASYPTQFHQMSAALHHLLNDGVMPSNLIISGDSEGAHIALCAISHILHQHSTLDEPPSMVDAFGGLLLISPRTTNSLVARSFNGNTGRDIVTKETLARWVTAFRAHSSISSEEGLEDDKYYTEPLQAPDEWWDGLASQVVKKVFISAGEDECLRDDIVTFSETWKRCGVDVTRVVEERGVQASPILDIGSGRPPSDLMLAIVSWLTDAVKA